MKAKITIRSAPIGSQHEQVVNPMICDLRGPGQMIFNLGYDDLTESQKLALTGPRGYDAFEVWRQIPGNQDKTLDDYYLSIRGKPFTIDDFTIEEIEEIKKPSKDAAAIALEVANHPTKVVDDYWHAWNLVNKEYENTGIRARGDVQYATFFLDIDTGMLTMTYDTEFTNIMFELGEDGILYAIINN